jgi:DNA-binding winged helix-turn-helix (wHTH) protein
MPANLLLFPPFRLDPANACLWRGAKRLALPPKDFAVLHHLATHAGQLVTHEELLQSVWPDTVVSSKGLKAFIRRLRQVLGDHPSTPRFIETVPRRGYRFLPAVTIQPVQSAECKVQNPQPSTPYPLPHKGRFFSLLAIFTGFPPVGFLRVVMPAQAGIQCSGPHFSPFSWIPAFAGMTLLLFFR